MKTPYLIAGAVAALGLGALVLWHARRGDLAANRNDAAGPRLAGMPDMPMMPSMPGMPAMPSAAVPNAPRQAVGPQAPAGLFSGMWG
ncbi:hypothetical protein [Roseateles violae]|uniref:Uncharacterized protein n=1 Tax=Roseateles violae TaxID=3058042 RepID=A0ABT8DT62_9BURK|nr:hypothetical protein [Pelomonas sp. PFR6]MDN3921504.1 hypothetical protein [Pelomonas sp. PFR6]